GRASWRLTLTLAEAVSGHTSSRMNTRMPRMLTMIASPPADTTQRATRSATSRLFGVWPLRMCGAVPGVTGLSSPLGSDTWFEDTNGPGAPRRCPGPDDARPDRPTLAWPALPGPYRCATGGSRP